MHFNSQWLRLLPIQQTKRPGALLYMASYSSIEVRAVAAHSVEVRGDATIGLANKQECEGRETGIKKILAGAEVKEVTVKNGPTSGIGYGDDIERAPNRGGLPGTPAQEENIEGHVDRLNSRPPHRNDQRKMQFTLDKRKRG